MTNFSRDTRVPEPCHSGHGRWLARHLRSAAAGEVPPDQTGDTVMTGLIETDEPTRDVATRGAGLCEMQTSKNVYLGA